MKSNLQSISIFMLALCVLIPLSARGASDNKTNKDTITLTGRIKIKGSEPMTFIALVTEEGRDYILVGEKADDLGSNHQLRLVELKGKLISKEAPVNPAQLEVLTYKLLE